MDPTLLERLQTLLTGAGMISLLALPVLLTIWMFVRIARAVPTLYRSDPKKTVIAVAFITLCSAGVWVQLAAFALEAYMVLNCEDGSCAQAGMITVMTTPLAWFSCVISWIVTFIVFSGKILPKLPLQKNALPEVG